VYDVAADGRFLINIVIDRGLAPITLLVNWNPGRVQWGAANRAPEASRPERLERFYESESKTRQASIDRTNVRELVDLTGFEPVTS
jgi:hypothetical protein